MAPPPRIAGDRPSPSDLGLALCWTLVCLVACGTTVRTASPRAPGLLLKLPRGRILPSSEPARRGLCPGPRVHLGVTGKAPAPERPPQQAGCGPDGRLPKGLAGHYPWGHRGRPQGSPGTLLVFPRQAGHLGGPGVPASLPLTHTGCRRLDLITHRLPAFCPREGGSWHRVTDAHS